MNTPKRLVPYAVAALLGASAVLGGQAIQGQSVDCTLQVAPGQQKLVRIVGITEVATGTPTVIVWTPTVVATETATAVPMDTVTRVATNTAVPTNTATKVPTSTAMATLTRAPTSTATSVPTSTVAPTATPVNQDLLLWWGNNTLDFGKIAVGTTHSLGIYVKAKTPSNLQITGVAVEGPFQYDGPLPMTMYANLWRRISVRFTPDTVGSYEQTMYFWADSAVVGVLKLKGIAN